MSLGQVKYQQESPIRKTFYSRSTRRDISNFINKSIESNFDGESLDSKKVLLQVSSLLPQLVKKTILKGVKPDIKPESKKK